MRFVIGRHGIRVIPESPQDVAYIEDTLGLGWDGAELRLVRRDVAHGVHLETERLLDDKPGGGE